MFLPGIELNTAEEVHLLGYFFDVDSAVDFGEKVYDALPDIKNVPEYFGRQLILNQNDEIIGEADKLLISALPWSFEQAADNILQAGGVPVPAHINKGANSLISNLGMIPETDGIFTLEISDKGKQTDIDSNRYNILTSSDAHFLWDISEKTHCLSLKRNFISNVFDYIKGNLK